MELRALTTLSFVTAALLLTSPALAQKDWLKTSYDDVARTSVASTLQEQGIDVSKNQIQILRDSSSYPRFRRRTGRAHLSWKASTAGAELQGTAKVKGDFGTLLGFDTGVTERVYVTKTNDKATALMTTRSRQVKTRDTAMQDAKAAFRQEVSKTVGQLGFKLNAAEVKADVWSRQLNKATFNFKNKIRTPNGKRVLKGEGTVDFTWQNNKITKMTPKSVTVTTNRRTIGTAIRGLFSRRARATRPTRR